MACWTHQQWSSQARAKYFAVSAWKAFRFSSEQNQNGTPFASAWSVLASTAISVPLT
mgnify:CR=1 FL=1